jgi:hypothetical protein
VRPCGPVGPVAPVGPDEAISTSSTAGWLVLVFSFESSVTLADPSDAIRIPALAAGMLAQNWASKVTSTLMYVPDAAAAAVANEALDAGTVPKVTVFSDQLPLTCENRRLPAACWLFTKIISVAFRTAEDGGRLDKSNCMYDCVVGLTLRFEFDP